MRFPGAEPPASHRADRQRESSVGPIHGLRHLLLSKRCASLAVAATGAYWLVERVYFE